jgi:poly(3-hydroxybutyrate) depolymerase
VSGSRTFVWCSEPSLLLQPSGSGFPREPGRRGEILKTILPQATHGRRELDPAERSRLQRFDQTEFDSKAALLADEGFVFIPKSCAGGAKCHLHLALHGCQQNEEYVQTQFVDQAGLNEWAIDNEIVILYPQVRKSSQNSNACWDWFGYTGAEFATQKAPQIQFLRRLINRVSGI